MGRDKYANSDRLRRQEGGESDGQAGRHAIDERQEANGRVG